MGFERYYLTGYYSHNDFKGRLVISFDPEDTKSRATLERVCGEGIMPFDERSYKVHMPKSKRIIGVDKCLGAKVMVTVSVLRYEFVPKNKDAPAASAAPAPAPDVDIIDIINDEGPIVSPEEPQKIVGSRLYLLSIKNAWRTS